MAQVKRRHFVMWTAAALGVAGAGLTAVRTSGYVLDPRIAARLKFFAPWQYLVMQAVGARIVYPETVAVADFADGYLAGLPASDQRDVHALIGVVEHAAPVFVGRFSRFTALGSPAQDAVLRSLEYNASGRLRGGFNVLKDVSYMALYRRDESWPAIGYPGPIVPRGSL